MEEARKTAFLTVQFIVRFVQAGSFSTSFSASKLKFSDVRWGAAIESLRVLADKGRRRLLRAALWENVTSTSVTSEGPLLAFFQLTDSHVLALIHSYTQLYDDLLEICIAVQGGLETFEPRHLKTLKEILNKVEEEECPDITFGEEEIRELFDDYVVRGLASVKQMLQGQRKKL